MNSAAWSAYEYQPSFVLGFHGCDRRVGESILRGEEAHLLSSQKKYDWLGHGIYFWEGNPARALAWAEGRKHEGKIQTPFVLGAIIDLRHCLDLFDRGSLAQVQLAHQYLMAAFRTAERETDAPRNVGKMPDKAGRALDCAVMNALHLYRQQRKEPACDSVRGPFLEGNAIYPSAGFRSENHIQLCARTTACVKGYFRPLQGHATRRRVRSE